jgi:uncharacterized protein
MDVFVTGGTGLVGRRIATRLRARGDRVTVLSRSPDAASKVPDGTQIVHGDPTVAGDWLKSLSKCDGVIHLAGEPITGGRWTAEFKQKIHDSRANSTRLIAQTLSKHRHVVLVSASAIGYYGMFEDNPTEFIEPDLPGNGFLPNVCVAWEEATKPASDAGVRVAIIRVGVVLAADGGALPEMMRPFRWRMGGYVGRGRQWISWIHVDDLASLFLFALDRSDALGPINGTAPEPLTNWGLSHLLAKVLNKPCWLPVPKMALRLLLGEMSELVTKGQRVIPMRAKTLGFDFQHAYPEPAIRNILGMEAD